MAGSVEFPRSESPRGAGVGEAAEPAFRYALPATPVAAASVDIGHVGVQVELFLAGDLDITTEISHPLRGLPAPNPARRLPADAAAFRACTLKALRAMAKGLMVTGLGTYTPTITSGARHVFTQTGHQFRAPNTMAFAGACTISFAQRCECGTVSVAGVVRYSLDVAALPLNGQLADAPGASGWFVRYEEELASIGMVVLVGVPIPPGQLV